MSKLYNDGMVESPHNQYKATFIRAYDTHADALFLYCYGRLSHRERAKSCVQEIFRTAWMHMTKEEAIDNMHAFLYKTADAVMDARAERRPRIPLRHFVNVCHEKLSNLRIHFIK